MEEKFRDWKVPKIITITYKDPDNQSVKKKVVLDGEVLFNSILQTLKQYDDMGLKLTNRELYYQLFSKNIIPNATEVYKRICVLLTEARYGGLIDWDAIEDRGRRVNMHAEWDNVEDLIDSAVSSYRLKRWENQHYYVEMYCEKEAGEGKLKPIADKYHIHFGANKGYSGASAMYNMAQRVKEQINNGKEVRILYFGDHDPSGLDMVRDIRDRVTEFLEKGEEYTEPNFEVIPIALNMEQIRKYKCPPNPAKITDSRAKEYIKRYGKVSWEMDSLRPEILISLAENAILEWINLEEYNAMIDREKEEIKALTQFGKKLNGGKGRWNDD